MSRYRKVENGVLCSRRQAFTAFMYSTVGQQESGEAPRQTYMNG